MLHGKNLPLFTGAVFVNSLQVLDSLQENPFTYGESVSASINLRYPGQYFDRESNLHYNWMRSYDPKVRGGYTQPDPIDLGGGWNKFAYAYQNPLSYTDPSGLCIGPLLAVCGWIGANAPWVFTTASIASSAGYAYVNGAGPVAASVPRAVSKLTPVAQAVEEGIASGAYCPAAKFFENTTLHTRVLNQMKSGDNHAFPMMIDEIAAKTGTVITTVDRRGTPVQMLTLPGERNGESGVYEYIKNSANQIYHRFFNPK